MDSSSSIKIESVKNYTSTMGSAMLSQIESVKELYFYYGLTNAKPTPYARESESHYDQVSRVDTTLWLKPCGRKRTPKRSCRKVDRGVLNKPGKLLSCRGRAVGNYPWSQHSLEKGHSQPNDGNQLHPSILLDLEGLEGQQQTLEHP